MHGKSLDNISYCFVVIDVCTMETIEYINKMQGYVEVNSCISPLNGHIQVLYQMFIYLLICV